MKKIILIILGTLVTGLVAFNTYKVFSIKSETKINQTIKEEYDSSKLEEELANLKQENETLTTEINNLKEELKKVKTDISSNKTAIADANKKINNNSDITSLKNKVTKLENVEKALLECLIIDVMSGGQISHFNIRTYNVTGAPIPINKEQCQNLYTNHKDYIKNAK